MPGQGQGCAAAGNMRVDGGEGPGARGTVSEHGQAQVARACPRTPETRRMQGMPYQQQFKSWLRQAWARAWLYVLHASALLRTHRR